MTSVRLDIPEQTKAYLLVLLCLWEHGPTETDAFVYDFKYAFGYDERYVLAILDDMAELKNGPVIVRLATSYAWDMTDTTKKLFVPPELL